jgi:protein TonB
MTKRQRLIIWGLIAGLHLALVAGLVFARIRKEPPVETPLMVSFISEEPTSAPQPEVPPPPPPPPPPPAPAPRMIAAVRPTPSPITAPPMEEVVREAAPSPPAPPQPPAPARVAVSAAPVAAITPPSLSAAYLNNPPPRLPEVARRKRHEGIVHLRAEVGADGLPDNVSVQRSSGFEELDAAAVETVRSKWKFVPARQGDRPVAGVVTFPIQFKITR